METRPLEVYAPQYFFLGAPYVMKDLGPLHAGLAWGPGKAGESPGGEEWKRELPGNCLPGPSPDHIEETALHAGRRLWLEASIARRTDVDCGLEGNRC